MDLQTLITKIQALIAAAKARSYMVAVTLILELLAALVASQPPTVQGSSAKRISALQTADSRSSDELVAYLETLCKDALDPVIAADIATLIEDAFPVLLALLAKYSIELRAYLGF